MSISFRVSTGSRRRRRSDVARGVVAAGAAALVSCVVSCSLLHRYDDIVGTPTASDDGGESSEASADVGTVDGAADCGNVLSSDRENCGACGHRCGAAACNGGVCAASLLEGDLAFPSCVVADGANVYWAGTFAGGAISRGGAQRDLKVTGTVNACVVNPDGPWLHSGPELVYVSSTGMSTVATTDGTNSYNIAARPILSPDDLVFDSSGRALATDHGGGAILTPSTTNPQYFDTLVSGLPNPFGLARSGDSVYVTMQGDDSVRRVDLADGGSTTLADNQSQPGRIAADESGVYWLNQRNGTVMRASSDGGVTVLAAGQPGPSGLTLDETSVYWTNAGGGTVLKVSKDGGAPTTLATGQDQAWAVAVDIDSVYWVTHVADGGVFRAPK